MMDGLYLVGSAAWILGLAELLASFSVGYFLAGSSGQTLREVTRRPLFKLAILGGVILFAFGLVVSVGHWWERAGWGGVMAIACWQWFKAWHEHQNAGAGE